MSYSNISSFGSGAANDAMNNPLTYCAVSPLDSEFNHNLGQRFGPYSGQCQKFMAAYCANNFDGICEYVSQNTDTRFPAVNGNRVLNTSCSSAQGIGSATTMGENLIRQTAMNKYLVAMSGNCVRRYEPFDPTVANSPLISTWQNVGGGSCVPIYKVDPSMIDSDPVMNKILLKPLIALDILINIYNTASREPPYMNALSNTKLGNFFKSEWFQYMLKNFRSNSCN